MNLGNLGKTLIMKFFNYTFYRVCDFYKKKKDSSAEFTSSLIVSLIQFFAIIDLLILIRVFWEYPIPAHFSKYWFVPILILIPIINWYKYVKPKKYIAYRKLWKDEHFIKKRKNGWKIIFYLVFSILIPILYGWIRHNLMEEESFFG